MKRELQEQPEAAAASAPASITSGGWTFSSDLSPEALAQIQGLIAMNGLPTQLERPAEGSDEAARAAQAAAADAAFAQMVASNPNATVIGGPLIGGPTAQPGDGVSEGDGSAEELAARSAAGEEAFQRLLAANPSHKEVSPGVFMVVDDDSGAPAAAQQ